MAKSKFGADYSKYLNSGPTEFDAFANPANEGQRVANARARAAGAGDTIGSGYLNPSSGELQDPDRGFGRAILSKPQIMLPAIIGGGLLAGLAAPGAMFGGGGGASMAAPGIPTVAGTGAGVGAAPFTTLATLPPFTLPAGGGASNMGFSLGSLFGKKGIDPTALLLGGLSMFGGDDSGQERQSYRGAGNADPVNSLNQALSAIFRLGQGLQSRGPTRLRNSVAPQGPSPVSIPGLPFQIGGGMGHDPALDDPTLLQGRDQGAMNQFDPFQSIAQGQMNPTPAPGARRRNPNGAT